MDSCTWQVRTDILVPSAPPTTSQYSKVADKSTDTLHTLLGIPPSGLNLNLQNASGNTPLHWAALNGHLSAVQALVKAGADVTIINGAGHDAIYAAEANEKNEVAEWLLREGKGLETGVTGSRRDGGIEAEGEEGGVEQDVMLEEGELEGEGDVEEALPAP